MARRCPGLLVLTLALAGSASGSQVDEERFREAERFQLFNACESMSLLAIVLDQELRERVETMAESRLRAARLYDADADRSAVSSLLSIEIFGVVGQAEVVMLSYFKPARDSFSERWFLAGTWEVHGMYRDSVQGLSELLDRFVLEYLRVNEAACLE